MTRSVHAIVVIHKVCNYSVKLVKHAALYFPINYQEMKYPHSREYLTYWQSKFWNIHLWKLAKVPLYFAKFQWCIKFRTRDFLLRLIWWFRIQEMIFIDLKSLWILNRSKLFHNNKEKWRNVFGQILTNVF